MTRYLISTMVFLPALAAIAQALLDPRKTGGVAIGRWVSFLASASAGFLGIWVVARMDPSQALYSVSESVPWMGSYSISYEMGIDGLSAIPILLVSILFPVLIAFEWERKSGARGMHGLLLMMQTALLGALCAQDLFLLFFFWAMSVLPAYFLVGIWGGEGREAAGFRSVISASLGNALFFCALILVYYSVDPHTFSIRDLAQARLSEKMISIVGREIHVSRLAFLLVCGGITLRTPVWPFHGWFTSVCREAPPSVTVAIAAGAGSTAVYLFLRLSFALFPDAVADASPVIVGVGVVSLVMGCLSAVVQRGLRLLFAFLCVIEMGLLLVGIGSLNPIGVVGSLYQLLTFGIAVSGLGLFIGMTSDRTGKGHFATEKGESTIGGAVATAPVAAVVVGIIVASVLGFPGLGGFVGNGLLMIGSFAVFPIAALIAAAVLLLEAYCLFTVYKFVFLGPENPASGGGGADGARFPELSLREQVYMAPIVVSLVVLGIYPKPLIDLAKPTVTALLSAFGAPQ